MISVVVPVYNVKEEYLRKCILSIIQQDYRELELILVDDGSADSSGEVCDEYSKKDERIKVLHQKNQGVSMARNNGIELAKGEWICFVDADDWIEEDAFSKVLSALNGKKPDMVVWNMYRDSDTGTRVSKNYDKTVLLENEDEIEKVRLRLLQAISTGEKNEYNITTLVYPFCHLYSRKLIEQNAVSFDVNFKQGEDKLFNYQYIANIHSMLYLNEALYHYRIYSQSVSHSFFSGHVDNSCRIMDKYYEIEPRIQTDERYKRAYGTRGGYAAGLLIGSYYLHKDSTVKKPLREFRQLMKEEPFHSAIDWIELTDIKDVKAKLSLGLLKSHWYFPMFMYAWAVNRVKGR